MFNFPLKSRSKVAGILATVTAVVAVPLPQRAQGDDTELRTKVVNASRVVWDARQRDGYTIWTAPLDGGEPVKLATDDQGQAWNLTLSRDNRHVAFVHEIGRQPSRLLVTRTSGGRAINVVAHGPDFVSIGPVGWSPDGRRVAFVGAPDRNQGPLPAYLWTVRRDGTHLRRGALLARDASNVWVFGELSWTRRGVIYSANLKIRILRDGHSTLLVRRGFEPYFSADGRWMVFRRFAANGSTDQAIWRAHPDGTGLERLFAWYPDGPLGMPMQWTPNHDGSLLLGPRSVQYGTRTETIMFSPTQPHEPTVLGVVKQSALVDWN